MKTFADLPYGIDPSTGPELDEETLRSLPEGAVLHFHPRYPADCTKPNVFGIRQLDVDDMDVGLNQWDECGWLGDEGEVFDSLDHLVSTHEIHYLRLPRLLCRLTVDQVKERSKDVTRRLRLPAGMARGALINLVDQIRRPGARVLAVVTVREVTAQRLTSVTDQDVRREGFPEWSRRRFIREFRRAWRLAERENPIIQRIEWSYL